MKNITIAEEDGERLERLARLLHDHGYVLAEAKSGEVRWIDGRMVAEKAILLKEIHHRVKNNLQVISSLLDLQVEMVHDGLTRKYFQNCQDRIRSMALVHEKLYQSKDLSAVDFSGYIDGLVRHLHRAYAPDQSLIDLEVDAGAITLSIDQAIPCGLIVNELVSNALKHAFRDQRSGKIRVGFRIWEAGRACLSVSDDGTGLPDGVDFRTAETLGLQLVNMLARQLGGDVNLDNRHGASFQIWFQGRC